MPTAKKRINLTVEDEIYDVLEWLSEQHNLSVASISVVLIRRALECQDDVYFSRIANERLGVKQNRVVHAKAWK